MMLGTGVTMASLITIIYMGYISRESLLGLGFFSALWMLTICVVRHMQSRLENEILQRAVVEDAIKEQKHVIEKIIYHLPIGLFAKDAKDNFRWVMWNRKAEELFEMTAEEVLGTNDYDHFPKHEADFFHNTDKKVMAGGEVIDIEAEDVTTKRGTWLGHTIKVPIYDDDGTPSILLGIIEDITDRKRQADAQLLTYTHQLENKNVELERARLKAESADRAKSDFLATMSHEIRTPLNGVIGSADLISRTHLDHTQEDLVRTIRKSAESLLHVINDVLDFSKIEARQLNLEQVAFDFNRTVEDVVDTYKPKAGSKRIELLVRYAPGTPTRVYGDPGRLRQILNNLISNALKFTERGYVMVNVQQVAEERNIANIRVAVQDTGIGIAPENQGKIFERFTQAESSTSRKFGGTGLGLAICRQLVELMGGKLTLESTPGIGSTFSFTLPMQVDANPLKPMDMGSLRGTHIALVDDNKVNLRIMEEMFSYWEAKTTSFTRGSEMLAWLDQQKELPNAKKPPFDIAVIDHEMPEMNGGELGQKLRAREDTEQMPMMIFSSHGMLGDSRYFEERGFNGYLVKPAPPEELRLMVCALIKAPVNGKILTRHYVKERVEATESPGKYGITILVAEDDTTNQKIIRLMLEEMGCNVIITGNGQEAVAHYQKREFDLILLDVQMPEMDGLEAAKEIRKIEKENHRDHTRIIALTASALRESLEACLEAGMDDYMTKPLVRARLEEKLKINYVIDHAQTQATALALDTPVDTN